MGKSSQTAADHDGSSDRITARVGSRTKKAKVVFDPSDHHVPRKRNRRGENDLPTATTPKAEPNRTATPSSSSSNDGGNNNVSTPSGGHHGATPSPSYRICMICRKNGPGRMPRKSIPAPWTCPSCLWDKESEKGNKSHHKIQEQSSTPQTSTSRVAEEEDNKQQHDFAGFSETELSGHGNDDTPENECLSIPIKTEPDPESGDDRRRSSDHIKHNQEKPDKSIEKYEKDIRYWSCDDVCRYFSQHCQDWGDLFQEQEIDGPSLLLMRRGDVLSRFGLKLGPAMELYQRIVALQNGDRDIVDVRLTWI
uniref:SAM domain-containing protein n=1 Tax=Anopheles atroparvus TaxID=41427 RepID=A0AAG5DY40_ANOAO